MSLPIDQAFRVPCADFASPAASADADCSLKASSKARCQWSDTTLQGCNLGASRDAGQVTVVDVLAAPLDWDARALYTRIRGAVIAANADGAWFASGSEERSSVLMTLVTWEAASNSWVCSVLTRFSRRTSPSPLQPCKRASQASHFACKPINLSSTAIRSRRSSCVSRRQQGQRRALRSILRRPLNTGRFSGRRAHR